MSVRLPGCIRLCASGGAVLVDGSALPQWFPDWRAAVAEAAARNLISPTGPSATGLSPIAELPHSPLGRSGSLFPVASVPGAAAGPRGGGVAGVGFPRTPATHLNRPHGGEAVDRLATAAAKGVREALANVDSGWAR